MNILEKSRRILEHPVCDHCLGRQFGQLLSGFTNVERGEAMRLLAASSIDKEHLGEEDKKLDLSNFSGIHFHKLTAQKYEIPAKKRCSICHDIFDEIPKLVHKITKATKSIEWRTFVVGTKLSNELLANEEKLWERVGIDYCEPIKAELNRELGKTVEKYNKGKKFDPKRHDVAFLFDLDKKSVSVKIFPLFMYGEYQKLVRGLPQTKWPTGAYKTSVEQIIAKPFMAAMHGKGHKLHGLGREDIDARCLAWRPFVLEILEPKKRDVDIKKLAKKIDAKKVRVKGMRCSNIQEVRKIKEAKLDKSYRAMVECEKGITRKDLEKLKKLSGETIRQKTPTRVLHRRADLFRKRRVVSISAKLKDKKHFQLTIRGEAGLYIKELISGDAGRTRPSVSEILDNKCVCKELDVIGIHKKNS